MGNARDVQHFHIDANNDLLSCDLMFATLRNCKWLLELDYINIGNGIISLSTAPVPLSCRRFMRFCPFVLVIKYNT